MRLPKGINFQVQFLSRKTRYFPPNLGSWTHFLGAPCGVPKTTPGEQTLFFKFGQIRVADVFWVALATAKDPHKSAHHEHQRVGFWVSDAAESLENTEIAVNTVVFVLLRTFPF